MLGCYSSLYMNFDDVLRKADYTRNCPRAIGALGVHMVVFIISSFFKPLWIRRPFTCNSTEKLVTQKYVVTTLNLYHSTYITLVVIDAVNMKKDEEWLECTIGGRWHCETRFCEWLHFHRSELRYDSHTSIHNFSIISF